MSTNLNIPTFAVVGQPNAGKSTVVATLAQRPDVTISVDPGGTIERKEIIARCDCTNAVAFIDTPGFQNTKKVVEWLRRHHSESDNPAEAFLAESEHWKKFPHDCEIMAALSAGSVALYVVDTDNHKEPDNDREAEILRLINVPRLGLLNPRRGKGEYDGEWKPLLQRELNNQYMPFNPFTARLKQRTELLERCRMLLHNLGLNVDQAIETLKGHDATRIAQTAQEIVSILRESVNFKHQETYSASDKMEDVEKRAGDVVKNKVREVESDFQKWIREKFSHSTDPWANADQLKHDIFDYEKTWKLLGWTKAKIIAAGALAGALGEWTTLGGPTYGGVGAIVGGLSAWLLGRYAVDVKNPMKPRNYLTEGTRKLLGIKSTTLGERYLEATMSLPTADVLLQRLEIYALHASQWPHGRKGDNTSKKVSQIKKPEGLKIPNIGYELCKGWRDGTKEKDVGDSSIVVSAKTQVLEDTLKVQIHDYLTKGEVELPDVLSD